MRNDSANPYDEQNRSRDSRPATDDKRVHSDIQDSEQDREKLKPEETIIELPDVKDIPGQEFINPAPLGMLADTTISSADEEGEGLFDDDEEDETDLVMGTEADVSAEERRLLERSETYLPTRDEDRLQQAAMDNTDFDGEALNEASFGEEQTGADLDVPGAADATRTDAMGQGDEENQHYSLGSGENDLNEQRPQP
ncbi:hypothetical protein [Flaviaesturariibacter amylovorans]|uniref:Uncharacterized protein n=1 Tax=Flaviaesturariibacter amylovorans TaxID=1084520 RepID=A0ABP8GGM3_9BACT